MLAYGVPFVPKLKSMWLITLALVYKSQDFFLGKKNFRTWAGIEPTLSHLQCDALPIELSSPWEQCGRKEGIQVQVLGAHYIRRNFSYGTPLQWRCCHCGTRLDVLAIKPNSSIIHYCSTCIQVSRFFPWKKNLRTWAWWLEHLAECHSDSIVNQLDNGGQNCYQEVDDVPTSIQPQVAVPVYDHVNLNSTREVSEI